MELEKLGLMHLEHEAWLKIVEFTKDKPITITAQDWASPNNAIATTQGQILIILIKRWGETLANLKEKINESNRN